MQEYDLEFHTNFDKKIFMILKEAELMEQLGNYQTLAVALEAVRIKT